MTQPLCFILMPFGQKPDGTGKTVDFDAVYRELIAPAVRAASMQPLRADEEMAGGIIHKPMYERLILCEYAVADLTTANANVFYELGLRHAVREWSTVCMFAEGRGQLPFDVALLRGLPYQLGADGKPVQPERDGEGLSRRLREAIQATPDSPVFQLVEDFPDVQRLKTDVFRNHVRIAEGQRQKLATARKQGKAAVQEIETQLGDIQAVEAGVVIDLFLSYRAVKDWPAMIDLVERMSPPLANTVMVREQLGLALNRNDEGERAEQVLLKLIEERGPSSETYGILGRVYKDRWEATKSGNEFLARGLLKQAIESYLKGFETDWRDAYPGINAVTLMELSEPPDPRRHELLPVVRYAVQRRIEGGKPDYWDHATCLELAVLAMDEQEARSSLADALAVMRETWEGETTARNLRLIREVRERRGAHMDGAEEIKRALTPNHQ
jgi:tetratricopeptide (TPR) repeat protein